MRFEVGPCMFSRSCRSYRENVVLLEVGPRVAGWSLRFMRVRLESQVCFRGTPFFKTGG